MIQDFFQDGNLLTWVLTLAFGFPALLIILGEIIVKLRRRYPHIVALVQIFRNLVLPFLALFIIFQKILKLPQDSNFLKITETFLWITLIYWGLSLINTILFEEAQEGSWQSNIPKLFLDLSRTVLVLLGTAIVLCNVWDADLGGLLTALGVGSLVIGLALQDSLGNIFSGLTLLFEQPVEIGDWVQIGDLEGQVVEITWRSVHIMNLDKNLLIVPNSELAGGIIKNYDRPAGIQGVGIEISFSYDDPPLRVMEILKATALETDGVLADPPPSAWVTNYGDFSISYKIRFFVDNYRQKLRSGDDFRARLWYVTKRYNLNMPYPINVEYEYTSFAPKPEEIKSKAIQILGTVPGWDVLEPQILQDVCEKSKIENFAKGEYILKESFPLEGLYVILEGKTELSLIDEEGQKKILGHLSHGEIFGEKASLLSSQVADVTAKAITELEVLKIETKTLQYILEEHPILASKLGEIMELRRKSVKAAQEAT
jgi:small-conductance mechanosensitive channel